MWGGAGLALLHAQTYCLEAMQPVQVYVTNFCPYCTTAKALLKKRGIPYEEIDVTHDPDKRAWLVQATGGRRTVPQIFIGGKSVGGSDDIHALDARGELMPMVQS
jgi:glutaredoxin 3